MKKRIFVKEEKIKIVEKAKKNEVQPIEILNLEKMQRRAAVYLEGQEAERMVFGNDLLFVDSYRDIAQATVMMILEEAQKQAQSVVHQEEKLLLEMAIILAEHTSLLAEELNALVKQYGSAKLKNFSLTKELGYKERLTEKVGIFKDKLIPNYGEN